MNMDDSIQRATERLGLSGIPNSIRKRRSDRGQSRLHPSLMSKLDALLSTEDRPSMSSLLEELETFCKQSDLALPSRATLYAFMAKTPTPRHLPRQLPEAVQAALYNLDLDVPVPGHQLAFYCFNYGNLAAASFAAGLPWLPLYQASRMRGFRPKSRGMLEAVLRVRGI